jgi:hypothetical protein
VNQYTPYVVLFVTLVLSGLGAYYGFVRRIENRVTIIEQRCINHQLVIDSIATLNQRIEKVTSDNETFWKILGPHLAGIIHSPRHRERDELVDRFVHGGLSDEGELNRLIDLLHEAIYSGRWEGDKKLAGALLLARTKATLEAQSRGG